MHAKLAALREILNASVASETAAAEFGMRVGSAGLEDAVIVLALLLACALLWIVVAAVGRVLKPACCAETQRVKSESLPLVKARFGRR